MTGKLARDPVHRLAGYLDHRSFISGQEIATALGCSRAAVWKHVETLRRFGIAIEAERGKGYRLESQLELLDPGQILSAMNSHNRDRLSRLEVLTSVTSTNDYLAGQPPDAQHARATLAEHQQRGKGRQGRPWASPFGRNIYLTLGWQFEQGIAGLECLPLVVALAACRALESCGVPAQIKWPNDLMLDGRKLGGCLVELRGDAAGPCMAMIGIGVNVGMRRADGEGIDQPWTDAASKQPGISRNALAAGLLDSLLEVLPRFSERGFGPFMEAWQARDALAGRLVRVNAQGHETQGRVLGIAENGALELQSAAGVAQYRSGEVRIQQKDV